MEIVTLSLIKKNKKVWLYINNQSHVDFFSHTQRVDALIEANKRFDTDLEIVSERFKDHCFGAYLWVFTSEFIRGEETGSLVRWHFIKQLVNSLFFDKSIKIENFIIATRIPKSLRRYLRSLNLSISYNILKYLFSILKYWGRGWLNVINALIKNLSFLYRKGNQKHVGAIVDINRGSTKHRFDSIEAIKVKFPNLKFFSGQEHPLEDVPKENQVVFRRELTLSKFLGSVLKSIHLGLFAIKNKKNIPCFLYYNIVDIFNLLMWFDLICYEYCVKAYLSKNNIQKIIHVSTLTKPTYRILMSEAKRRNMDFTLVASRTLMRYRSSERILDCDIKGYNNTALPTKYIFKDQYSSKIFDQYPEMKKNVQIGGSHVSKTYRYINYNNPVAILILFNHTKELLNRLLNEIIKGEIPSVVNTIIFRCHPNYVISKDEMLRYFPNNQVIDITGKDYSLLSNYRTVTISGATTGALDAIQWGTVILWVPYIWDDGILMDDLMNILGVNCLNSMELKKKTIEFIINPNLMAEQYNKDTQSKLKYFNTKCLISDLI